MRYRVALPETECAERATGWHVDLRQDAGTLLWGQQDRLNFALPMPAPSRSTDLDTAMATPVGNKSVATNYNRNL